MAAAVPPAVPAAPPASAPSAPSAPAKAQAIQGFWESFKEFFLIPFDKAILGTIPEIGHLSPVIFTIGTLFLAAVTLNYPLAVFGATSVEANLLYSVIKLVSDYTVTPTLGISTTASPNPACRSVFQTLTPPRFKSLMDQRLKQEFPNTALYYITFAASYCIQSMYFFSKECSELGPQYSNRPYLAILGSGLFIVLYAMYLFAYGCDSMFSIFFTVLIGSLVGYLLCYQNYLLLGKPGVNLLFIPPLARRGGLDYICVTTNSPKK
jgi:hypothetical protein